MTYAEAKLLGTKLTDINVKYWDAIGLQKKTFSTQFTEIYNQIILNGFLIKKSKKFNTFYNRRVPIFKIIDPSESFLEIKNNTPKTLKISGDCTTRCISFCTGIDYMEIRREQLYNASYYDLSWRTQNVWERSLISRGFKSIRMPKPITRKTFIKTFGNNIKHGFIATVSSGHVAAIDMSKQKVLDTWDSTNGRITLIYVHTSQYYDILNLITKHF